MTVARMLIAAFCALAAGVAVENAKASHACAASDGASLGCVAHTAKSAVK